jgi:hypothetical protein
MDNKKTYSIVINGISESVKQVDALNDALQFLDQKIKNLESRTVNVSSNSSGASSKVQEYHTEDQLLKNIAKTEQEIANVRREEYQQLLADKDLLKEAKQLQEDRAASERLAANNYANTMRGVKQELSDIKKVMQGTDLGSDEFGKLTKRANELNSKLLEVEKSYGQFGRNVGNYPDAEKGMKALSFTIAGVTQNFDNAKQAYATLKKELTTLQVKQDQGMLLSDEELQRFEELSTLVPSIASSIQDAGKPMDNLLDSMESFVALTQVSKGFSSFFGIDNTKADEAMKKLLALQNAMQGLQKIQKQMRTMEGIGKYFTKASQGIDKFVDKLFGVDKASKAAAASSKTESAALNQVNTASKGAAVGAGAATTANVALTGSEVAATLAAKALKMALNALGIGVFLTLLGLATDALDWAITGVQTFLGISRSDNKVETEISSVTKSVEILEEEIDDLVEKGALTKLQGILSNTRIEAEGMVKAWKQLKKVEVEDNAKNSHFLDYLIQITKASKEAAEAQREYDARNEKSVERYKKAQAAVNELYYQMGSDEVVKKAMSNLEEFFGNDEAAKWAELILDNFKKVKDGFFDFSSTVQENKDKIKRFLNSDEENEKEDVEKQKEELKRLTNDKKEQEQIEAKAKKKLADIEKKHRKEEIDKAKQHAAEILQVQQSMEDLRLRLTENEIAKRMFAIKKEKDNALQNFKGSLTQRNELIENYNKLSEKEFNKYYKDLTEKFDNFVKNIEKKKTELEKLELSEDINSLIIQSSLLEEKKPFDVQIRSAEEYARKMDELTKKFGNLEEAQKRLKEARSFKAAMRGDKDIQIGYFNRWFSKARDLSETDRYFVDKFYAELRKTSGEVTTEVEVLMSQLESIVEESYIDELELNEYYGEKATSNLSKSLKARLAQQIAYDYDVLRLQDNYVDKKVELEKELAKKEYEAANEAAMQEYDTQKEGNEKLIKSLKDTIAVIEKKLKTASSAQKAELEGQLKDSEKRLEIAEKNTAIEGEIYQNYYIKRQENEKAYQRKLNEIAQKGAEERSNINKKYFENQITNFRDFQTKINAVVAKQPVYDKLGFGIVNLSATKKNLKEVQDGITIALKEINNEKVRLAKSKDLKIISKEEYNNALRSLNDLESSFKESGVSVQNSLKELGGQWWGSIDKWLQEIGSSMSSILSSLSEITTNEFNKEIEAVEDEMDKYAKLLDKQKDITQKYADDVNSIEDELKTARGDRRQQLIDNLNAEMAAQRASLAEEKRIEKEQEKLERKKAELEYERDYAEWESNMWQAAINASMAVSMAAVNKWPIPAIPMMSLAAAVGAAQIAAVNSNKPTKKYASGGVIDGNSHAQGGVQAVVGTSPIELEGNEFIIRKSTATQNINLLDYINRSERKLNLSDFIDFYSSNKVRSNIQSIKSKFETGGVIPTLRTDISLSNGLLTAFEEYANRTTVVQVVDIVDAEDRLNKVKVLSGLNE